MNTNKKRNTQESGVVNLLIKIFLDILEYEKKFIMRNDLFSLIAARCLSIIAILFSVYLLTATAIFIGKYIILSYFYDFSGTGTDTDYFLSLHLVIGLPLIINIITNFTNRDFVYSERVIDLLETLKYSSIRINSLRTIIEVFCFICFLVFYSYFMMHSLAIFINEELLISIFNNFSIGILGVISATVYLTVRILFMEELNTQQRYFKSKRSFYLWLTASLLTFIFVINDLFDHSTSQSFEFPFACVTLLLAIEKTRDSYKQLKVSLIEYLGSGER